MNTRNEWRELLAVCNNALAEHGAQLECRKNKDDEYSVIVRIGGRAETYAEGYYEDELGMLVNDAWAYVLARLRKGGDE